MNLPIHQFSEWFAHLTWYQYLGEVVAIILYFVTFTSEKLINLPKTVNFKLLRNFLRQTSFLLAFACIAIPWLMSEIF